MLLRLPSPHDSVSQNARAHEQQGSSWQDYAYRRSTGLGHLLRLGLLHLSLSFLHLSLSFLRLSLSLLHLLLLGEGGLRLGLHRLFHRLFLWGLHLLFLRHSEGRQEKRNHESEGNQRQQPSHVSSLRHLPLRVLS